MREHVRQWILVFCLAEALVYAAFLWQDLRPGGGDTTWLKYGGILLCAAFSLTWSRRGGSLLVAAAQLLTLWADWFLLVLDQHYGLGVLIFCAVQLLYFLRLYAGNGGRSLWTLRLALVMAAMAGLWGLGLFIPLNALALVYFSNFLVNVCQSWGLSGGKARVFAAGLTLFLCCDICVGLHQFQGMLPEETASLVRVGMWLVYLPAQVLISLSGLPGTIVRGDCCEDK